MFVTWDEAFIDAGAQAHVYCVTRPGTREFVACKVFNENVLDSRFLYGRESWFLQFLQDCRHVVRLASCVPPNFKHHPYVLYLEYAHGRDLYYLRKHLKQCVTCDQWEGTMKIIVRQLIEALHDIHEKGVVHFDVKLENVLLLNTAEGPINVALADFGYACLQWETPEQAYGTAAYVPPERRAPNLRSDPITAADMWAVGVLLLLALEHTTPESIVLCADAFWEENKNAASQSWQAFTRQLLHPDPRERMTAKQALQHEWLAGEPSPIPPASDAFRASDHAASVDDGVPVQQNRKRECSTQQKCA